MFRSRLLACCLIGMLAACADDATPDATNPPVPVEVAEAKALSGADTVRATGTIAREREQALSFRWPGVVRQLTVDVGDTVRQGQVIARLDDTAARAQLRDAEASHDKATRDLARDTALAKDGWISPQRLADRQTARNQARAALDAARFDLRWATLTAPSAGVVLGRHIEAGEVVAAGQSVVTLADAGSPMIVRVPLSDRAVAQVRQGQRAEVVIEAVSPAPVAGTISRIGARADPRTGTVDVEVRLPAGLALKTGYLASVSIAITPAGGAATDRLRVPAEAILEADAGRATVYTVAADGKTARRKAVGFHGFDGDDAIVSGLAAGSRVITRGGAYVRDGGPIAVTTLGQG